MQTNGPCDEQANMICVWKAKPEQVNNAMRSRFGQEIWFAAIGLQLQRMAAGHSPVNAARNLLTSLRDDGWQWDDNFVPTIL